MPPLFSGQISDAISELLINLPTRETTLVVKPISHCRSVGYCYGYMNKYRHVCIPSIINVWIKYGEPRLCDSGKTDIITKT
jgi:hypothetical protein